MDLDLDELVDLELGLVVEHEEYQGKQRAKVVDFTPAGGSDDDGDVTVDDDNDTGNSETYTEEQVLEMDEDELDELVEELGLGGAPRRCPSRPRSRRGTTPRGRPRAAPRTSRGGTRGAYPRCRTGWRSRPTASGRRGWS